MVGVGGVGGSDFIVKCKFKKRCLGRINKMLPKFTIKNYIPQNIVESHRN